MNKIMKVPGGDIFNFNSHAEVQEWCSNQVRRKGFKMAAGVGFNSMPIDLPGDVRAFVGIVLFDTNGDPDNVATLTINSSIRIERVSNMFLSRVWNNIIGGNSNPYTTDEVFPVPYPLTGKDDIIFGYNADTAADLFFTVLYI